MSTRQGRRRVALAAAIVTALAAAIVAYGIASSDGPHVPPSVLDKGCASQYTTLANGIDQLPTGLPTPTIDLRHTDGTEFRLYATHVNDVTKQVVLDCSLDTTGAITANLTVSDAPGSYAIGDGSTDGYYRDYLADGSGALVGTVAPGTTSVIATDDEGTALPAYLAGGYFVFWSATGALDGTHIVITAGTADPVNVDDPTYLAGTYSPPAFQDACARALANPGNPPYTGSTDPAVQMTSGSAIAWVYSGSAIAVCAYDTAAHTQGFSLTTDQIPGDHPRYGMMAYQAVDSGLIVGKTPDDTAFVTISTPVGSYHATTDSGVFAAWAPESAFDNPATKVIAVTATTTYTISTDGTSTTTD